MAAASDDPTDDPAVAAALADDLTIDITTIGRRSGERRRIEIWFLNVDGRIFITGTPGRRDWMANLLAEPRFTFHLKESVTADLDAEARPVDDEPTRRLVIEHAVATWYRAQTSVDDLIESAPMVEVTFV
ncbi:MAG: nitroreductase/quinone reductase family protein [Actinomycetota bacterium]